MHVTIKLNEDTYNKLKNNLQLKEDLRTVSHYYSLRQDPFFFTVFQIILAPPKFFPQRLNGRKF